MTYPVWKSKNLSATQILREINLTDLEPLKTILIALAVLEA